MSDQRHHKDPSHSLPSNIEQILAALAGLLFLYGLFALSSTLLSLAKDVLRTNAEFEGISFHFFQSSSPGLWSINPGLAGIIAGPLLWKRRKLPWACSTLLAAWAFVESAITSVRTIINPYENSDAAYLFIPIGIALLLSLFLLLVLITFLSTPVRKLIST